MSEVPTVRIQNPKGDGYLTINADDFDGAKHNLFSEAPTPATPSTPATAAVVPQKESDDATQQQTSEPEQVDAALASVLDRPARDVVDVIVAGVDGPFAAEQLLQLRALEAQGKARKTVLEVIDGLIKAQ